MNLYEPPSVQPASIVARRFRVKASWLKGEAEAGRMPHVRADDQILFDPETVDRELLKRARQEVRRA